MAALTLAALAALVVLGVALRLALTWMPRPSLERSNNKRLTLANLLTRPFSYVEWAVKREPERYQPDAPQITLKQCGRCTEAGNCYAHILLVPACLWGLPSTSMRPGQADKPPQGQPVPPYTWRRYRRLLRAENLRPATWRSLREDPRGRYLIAALYDPATRDFHFFVLDADGVWSHKPGSTAATDRDSRGRLVRSPRRAATYRKYWFCGYFWAIPSDPANPSRAELYDEAVADATREGRTIPQY